MGVATKAFLVNTHMSQGSHYGVRKMMTTTKVSCVPLFIHKSNVVVVVGVASRNGVTYSKHFSTIIGMISSHITFQEGKITLGCSCRA